MTNGDCTAVITLPARVDIDCAHALRSRGERALDTGSRTIAVDLSASHHVDIRGLSELVAALRRMSRRNVRIALVGADSRVRWVLELCAIDGIEFHPTLRRALADAHDPHRSVEPARRRATASQDEAG